MKRRVITLALIFGLLSPAFAEPREALLMGGWNYTDGTYPPLPEKGIQADIDGMKSKLEAMGFHVQVEMNPTLAQAKAAVDAFGKRIKESRTTALFYFTGHGSEFEGRNYLIPVRSSIATNRDLDDEALPVGRILGRMEEASATTNGVNVVLLDCCRNALSKSGSGLAVMEAKGTFIGFATRSQSTAQTTTTGSYYTKGLLKHLATPGISITDMHTLVTQEVKAIDPSQMPFQYSGLDAIFCLATGTSMMPSGLGSSLVKTEPGKPLPSEVPAPSSGPSLEGSRPGQVVEFALTQDVSMKFCYCPEGSFLMGSPADEQGHQANESRREVKLNDFWMAKTECTQAQWMALTQSNPSDKMLREGPVQRVSWEDALGFIARLNAEVTLPEGWRFTLPTEAQWEYACRADTYTPFHFGTVLDGSQANVNARGAAYGTSNEGTSIGRNVQVASFPPNAWGLYDMHGNVWEWCLDAWDGSSSLPGGTNPVGTQGQFRVQRGGSGADVPVDCRSATRDRGPPSEKLGHVGFRVAIVPQKVARAVLLKEPATPSVKEPTTPSPAEHMQRQADAIGGMLERARAQLNQ